MDISIFSDGRLLHGGRALRCALGAGGVTRAKREGDKATPAGRFPLRRVLYRPDRLAPPRTALSVAPIRPEDGWCDAPDDARYNRPVTLPYPASHERLWREDEPPAFACLLSSACPRETLELVDGMLTLAHESWHLRGVKDEARTQCYAVQSLEATARLFELLPADARLVALYVAVQDAAAPRDRYHSRECRPGGAFDLAPHTPGWPSG